MPFAGDVTRTECSCAVCHVFGRITQNASGLRTETIGSVRIAWIWEIQPRIPGTGTDKLSKQSVDHFVLGSVCLYYMT